RGMRDGDPAAERPLHRASLRGAAARDSHAADRLAPARGLPRLPARPSPRDLALVRGPRARPRIRGRRGRDHEHHPPIAGRGEERAPLTRAPRMGLEFLARVRRATLIVGGVASLMLGTYAPLAVAFGFALGGLW